MKGREEPCLSRFGNYFFHATMLVRELQMSTRDVNHHTSGMGVHLRLLMWPVVNVHYLHLLILKRQLVMAWFDQRGVLCESHARPHAHCGDDPDYLDTHGLFPVG